MVTSRPYDGELVEVEVESGARVRTTTDHPFIALVGDTPETVLAENLEVGMPLPVVVSPPVPTVDPLMGVLQPPQPQGPLEMRVAWSRIRQLRRHQYVDEVVYSLEVPEPTPSSPATASWCTTASPRTCRRSSSWPATPGTTSSC